MSLYIYIYIWNIPKSTVYMIHVWYILTTSYLGIQVRIVNEPSFTKHKPKFNPGLEKENEKYFKKTSVYNIL